MSPADIARLFGMPPPGLRVFTVIDAARDGDGRKPHGVDALLPGYHGSLISRPIPYRWVV
jgi:hypothetical protein